jgi:hypothetical protein
LSRQRDDETCCDEECCGQSVDSQGFLDRLVPVCASLLDAADAEGQLRRRIDAYELMRGVGNICIGSDDPRYEPRHLIELVLEGSEAAGPSSPRTHNFSAGTRLSSRAASA